MRPTERLDIGFTEAGRDQRGFSIMELVVVCSIMGVIAILAFPRVQSFSRAQETKESATQMAGILEMARSRAVSEATPHLVFVNEPTVDENGACGPVAVIVRDLDHDYKLSAGDRQDEISLSPEACQKVKRYGEDDDAKPYEGLELPLDDLAARAGSLVSGLLGGGSGEEEDEEESSGSGSGSSGSGSSGSGSSGKGKGKSGRTATIEETVVNGATFPLDEVSGRPVVAFSERGVPVDPATPTRWGSGAGAIYLTDGHSALYAAVVNPLGGIKLKKYEVKTQTWR